MKIFKKLNPLSWFKRDPVAKAQAKAKKIMKTLDKDATLALFVWTDLSQMFPLMQPEYETTPTQEFDTLMDEADVIIAEAEDMNLDEAYPPVSNPDAFFRSDDYEDDSDIFTDDGRDLNEPVCRTSRSEG